MSHNGQELNPFQPPVVDHWVSAADSNLFARMWGWRARAAEFMAKLTKYLLMLVLVMTGLAFGVTAAHAATDQETIRKSVELTHGWRFIKRDVPGGEQPNLDDSGWQAVDLPHTYNVAGMLNAKEHYRGPAWYRKQIDVSAVEPGRRTYIEFDGAFLITDLWVNGVKAGHHEGGFAGFRFDITPFVKQGHNVLAVRVDSSKAPDVAPLGGDFTVFGGLYRGVRLISTDDVHIDMLDYGSQGVVFQADGVSADTAGLNWTVRVANNSSSHTSGDVVVNLYDAGSHLVKSISAPFAADPKAIVPVRVSARLEKPHLWNGISDPYLYKAQITVTSGASRDRVNLPIGIRDIRIDPDRGVILNGQPYAVHGVNLHPTMLPGKGAAVSRQDIDRDYKMLGDLGVTGLRFAHYQHGPYEYDLADRAGYLVWTEIPLVSEISGSAAFEANAGNQLRELVRQNINHPSVFVWGLGNEIYEVDENSGKLLDAMQSLAHAEDPGRPTTYANCCGEIDGPQASHTDMVGSNVYFGWYTGEFSDLGPWMDRNHARRPHTPEAISEYGAGGSIIHQDDPPKRPLAGSRWHPEQYQSLYHEAAWRQIRDKPWLWASFIWVGFDFPSAGRNEGDTAGINDKGLITFDRKTKKDAYFWYQANWSKAPMVYITSRRYTVRATPYADLKIYSNQSKVTVTVNDAVVAEQPVVDHVALMNIALRAGINHIKVSAGSVTDDVTWIFQPPSSQ